MNNNEIHNKKKEIVKLETVQLKLSFNRHFNNQKVIVRDFEHNQQPTNNNNE